MPHCFLCLNFYFKLNVFSFWMFYIRNLPLQTFYFEPLINLMHKLVISWDCSRSRACFCSPSASLNSQTICALRRTYTFLTLSLMFLLTFWWSLCSYSLNICISIYLYVIYLAWQEKKQHCTNSALGKYLQCWLERKLTLYAEACGLYFPCSWKVMCPQLFNSMFSQWDFL